MMTGGTHTVANGGIMGKKWSDGLSNVSRQGVRQMNDR
jgi:hypothetical protein